MKAPTQSGWIYSHTKVADKCPEKGKENKEI